MVDHQLVKRFCVQKLAEIICECVECALPDRALLDWVTAERIIGAESHVVSDLARAFAMTGLDKTYDSFVRLFGGELWNKRARLVGRAQLGYPYGAAYLA